MLLEIKSLSGQSMYDLCLMAYGTLGLLVKFCNDNGIENVNTIPGTGVTLIYDDALVVNQQITGIVLATANI